MAEDSKSHMAIINIDFFSPAWKFHGKFTQRFYSIYQNVKLKARSIHTRAKVDIRIIKINYDDAVQILII